jgi:hypothetical protein
MQKSNRRPVVLVTVAALLAVWGGPERTDAAPPRRFGTPASRSLTNPSVSPYLNLAQPGIDPAIAYQTIIRPEQQMRRALANQSQDIGRLQRDVSDLQPGTSRAQPVLHRTGHQTTFMSTGNYFPLLNARRR